MRRFFVGEQRLDAEIVVLDAAESRHLEVLRLRVGDLVELYDGQGTVAVAEIIAGGRPVRLKILQSRRPGAAAGSRLVVAVAAVKVKKMEILLEKCTELGVDGFLPMVTGRSQGSRVEQLRGRGDRWRRIIAEACKQSRRPKPMELYDLCRFEDLLEDSRSGAGERLLLYEKEKTVRLPSLQPELQAAASILLAFGPEGGFSGAEREAALEHGFRSVGLGERPLRTETAVIVAVALVQQALGHI